ncbi:MAG: PilT/PilU family type 4a pilus ATPase [Candidatus Omnitrophica bacterium]|nr:PilT/PilU family type 4a pilus ATPase [Candidatus Omnitrophota bacterium]
MAKIDFLFKTLIEKKGSDLHLEQGQKPKLRINGKLADVEAPVLTGEEMTSILSEIASPQDWEHFESYGDIDFAYIYGTEARFRVNYFRHFYGLGAVMRIIPSQIKTIEELELPPKVTDFCKFRSGLVVVTGPTGSGKSTTLASLINHINANQSKKIVTIEEPVEFMHTNKKSIISHREVGLDTESFANGLRAAVKSDADIILVGEMRDRETIELALNAAEMGILVFGTLHTNSATKTIDRIIDAFAANRKNQIRTILSNTLKAIIAQQLLPSSDKTRRYAAHEILVRTQALPAIIQAGETVRLTSEIQVNKQLGMQLMDDSLMELVRANKVTREEAYMKAIDKSKFSDTPAY